jgi:Mu-like prophage protein gpG
VLFAKKSHTRGVKENGAHQVKIPARPFLGISAADDRELQEIIREWVIGQGLK